MINLFSVRKKHLVYCPEELLSSGYTGAVYGYYHEESGIFNITGINDGQNIQKLGYISETPNEERNEVPCLTGIRRDGNISFSYLDEDYQLKPYSLMKNIFSRNSGILETDWMRDKCAFIFGCGSIGSFLALELAKAGLGRFVLVDNDIMDYHNICRHQCGINDVGDFKVNALKKRILNINPTTDVITCKKIAEEVPQNIFDQYADASTLMIGAADNRTSDVYINKIAIIYSCAFLSCGFWERAFAGEIFYYLPDSNMPCYEYTLGESSALSNKVESSRHFYTMNENPEEVYFEPGIAVDIDFVSCIATKLAIDILNRQNTDYIPKVINYLTQFTLICNTNDSRIGGYLAGIFKHPLQVTHSIYFEHNCKNCAICKYQDMGEV